MEEGIFYLWYGVIVQEVVPFLKEDIQVVDSCCLSIDFDAMLPSWRSPEWPWNQRMFCSPKTLLASETWNVLCIWWLRLKGPFTGGAMWVFCVATILQKWLECTIVWKRTFPVHDVNDDSNRFILFELIAWMDDFQSSSQCQSFRLSHSDYF